MRQVRNEVFKWLGVQPKTDHRFQSPTEARGGKREGRWRGMSDPFTALQMRGERGTDAVPEWIARREDHRRATAAGKDAVRIERNRPGPSALADVCKHQMPFAAEHRFGLGNRLSACVREAGKAILAD